MKIKLILSLLLCVAATWGQEPIRGGRVIYGSWDAGPALSTRPFKSDIASNIPTTCNPGEMFFATDGINGRQLQKCTSQDTWNPVGYDQGTVLPLTCGVGQLFFKTDAVAGQNLFMCDSTDHWTQQLNTGGGVNKEPGCVFDGGGSVIAVNSICYKRARTACTLSTSYSILAVGTGPTATINVFKIASGTALPTASIISSSTPTLTTGNAVIGATVLSTTAVAADDILAFKVTAVTNATWLDVSLKCN